MVKEAIDSFLLAIWRGRRSDARRITALGFLKFVVLRSGKLEWLVPPFTICKTHPKTNNVDLATLRQSSEHISLLERTASHIRPT